LLCSLECDPSGLQVMDDILEVADRTCGRRSTRVTISVSPDRMNLRSVSSSSRPSSLVPVSFSDRTIEHPAVTSAASWML
jgi:hypothetical protein